MTMIISPRVRWLALATAVLVMGCGKKGDDGKIPLSDGSKMPADSVHKGMTAPLPPPPDLTPAAKVPLDSGNVLFRKKVYKEALVQYRASAAAAPGNATPLYGMYMVGSAVKDLKLADSALAEIRKYNAVPAHDAPDTAALKELHKKATAKAIPKA